MFFVRTRLLVRAAGSASSRSSKGYFGAEWVGAGSVVAQAGVASGYVSSTER